MENRVIEFGYSSNLGGVEVFIRNIIMNTSIPIDLAVTTEDKIPFEDEFAAKGVQNIQNTEQALDADGIQTEYRAVAARASGDKDGSCSS